MFLPIWSLFLLGKNWWSWIIFLKYGFLLQSLIMLLFFQQFYCLLRINIAPFIATSSYRLYLFCKVFFSSSSLDLDIKITLLVVLVFGWISFLGEMCVGFKGLLFFKNLSFKLSPLLFSSYGCSPCFFFPMVLLPVKTPFETKLLGLWQMAYIFFWLSFGCSFHHVFLTFLPSN